MSVLHPLATNGSDDALAGAELWFAPDWLETGQADALFAELRDAIKWETHRIRLFGREVDSPRLSSWIGDEDAAYTYSGTRFQPRANWIASSTASWPTAIGMDAITWAGTATTNPSWVRSRLSLP